MAQASSANACGRGRVDETRDRAAHECRQGEGRSRAQAERPAQGLEVVDDRQRLVADQHDAAGARHASLAQRSQGFREVVDVDRLDALAPAGGERQQRKRRRHQEQARARAVGTEDERRLRDDRLDAAREQRFVGRSLAQMETARRVGVGTERRDLDDSFHARSDARFEEGDRTARMHGVEGLHRDFAKDADGIDGDVDALELRRER